MTEKHIIQRVAKDTGYDEKIVETIVEYTFKALSDAIMRTKIVQIRNFGSFHLKHLRRRVIGTHYMSGEEAVSPEHYKINFMAYADLKRRAERKMIRDQKRAAEEAEEDEEL